MQQVIVNHFGGPETLRVEERPLPIPTDGQIRVRITSIGMNHADLMARRGEYKLSSGDPPFTPGIEAGGVIDAVGAGVVHREIGQRVILGAGVPRGSNQMGGGTYRSHYLCAAEQTVPAPDAIPDEQLGAIWLPYLTAWGCLVWKQGIKPGNYVAFPAASSSVSLAAAQVARQAGAISIGLTSHAEKIERLRALPEGAYDHIVLTRNPSDQGQTPWPNELKQITHGHGVDVFMDPIAAGEFLNREILCLAQHGAIWVYGLLGNMGLVNVHPLIRKHARIQGWLVNELIEAGHEALTKGYDDILKGFTSGIYRQHVHRVFKLKDVRQAHEYMEQSEHIGKLVLQP
jgi:NADPH:quinone reductase-like Zn-dependent oxidoreductase